MSTSIEALIPELQQPCRDLLALAGAAGVGPQITSTLRTHSQQKRLYERYLAGNSAYPAAPPGTSAHEFGYAFDMLVVGSDNQNDLGSVWASWGGKWGGARDPIHFEYPGFSPGAPAAPRESNRPAEGGVFYTIADFLIGFVPGLGWLGKLQIVDWAFRLFGGNETLAEWYLQHPAELIRDVIPYAQSWLPSNLPQ